MDYKTGTCVIKDMHTEQANSVGSQAVRGLHELAVEPHQAALQPWDWRDERGFPRDSPPAVLEPLAL